MSTLTVTYRVKRRHERKRVAIDVRFWRDGLPVHGRTRDLSHGGAFIETPEPLVAGSSCLIELSLPALSVPAQMSATVRWSNVEGMGVQWATMRAQHAWAVSRALER